MTASAALAAANASALRRPPWLSMRFLPRTPPAPPPRRRSHAQLCRTPWYRVDGDGRLFLGGAVARAWTRAFLDADALANTRLAGFLLLAVLRFSRYDSSTRRWAGALRGTGLGPPSTGRGRRARGSGADERGGGDGWGRWCALSLSSSTWNRMGSVATWSDDDG